MRVLIACMQFPTEPGRSYMTTELARALVAEGHEVEVLLLDWSAQAGQADGPCQVWDGVKVVRAAPRAFAAFGGLVRNASKFVLSGRHAARLAQEQFDLRTFDVFIAWAPALAIAPLVRAVRRTVPHRLLFIWDFFPDHHHEIGRIPGGPPYWISRAWEQSLMGDFSAILCTLPQNAEYLHRRFRVRDDQKVRIAPIWSDVSPVPRADRAAVRRRHGLPPKVPIAVFGGQLVEGRGFDQMLAAAELGRRAGSPLVFLFVGDGRLAPMLQARAKTQDNVLCRPAMPRESYLQLLGACDVGMVATVPGVSSFSIPSKTLDYLRAGLPVVAAVEPGSDFAALLERYGVGRTAAFGDPAGFLAGAQALARGPRIGAAAGRCLDEVFHIRHAVAAVVSAAS
jgi:glycosyltransferase involved in cell wall biosynthesis